MGQCHDLKEVLVYWTKIGINRERVNVHEHNELQRAAQSGLYSIYVGGVNLLGLISYICIELIFQSIHITTFVHIQKFIHISHGILKYFHSLGLMNAGLCAHWPLMLMGRDSHSAKRIKAFYVVTTHKQINPVMNEIYLIDN